MRKSGNFDVCVIGGAGHIGVPLSLVLASKGRRTLIIDKNIEAMELLLQCKMPFYEEGAEELLKLVLSKDLLGFSSSPEDISNIPIIIITIGTPIDEYHNPVTRFLTDVIDELNPFFTEGQTIILRSTVAPGSTNFLEGYVAKSGKKIGLAFCPERVVQGNGIHEIQELPQIISGVSDKAREVAKLLFESIAPKVIETTPLEAEYVKLLCNAYRYIQFAATNQLYMLVDSSGLNYSKLIQIASEDYPRMAYIPGPGFSAGPCLMKDTMQLFAFENQNFILGNVAVLINEGLPNFIVEKIRKKMELRECCVGILGMTFKADSDDIRDSLSFKLKKILEFYGAKVICSDEYYSSEGFVSSDRLIAEVDCIVIGTPHKAYKELIIPEEKEIIDLWDCIDSSSNF